MALQLPSKYCNTSRNRLEMTDIMKATQFVLLGASANAIRGSKCGFRQNLFRDTCTQLYCNNQKNAHAPGVCMCGVLWQLCALRYSKR